MSIATDFQEALLPWRTVTPDDLGTYAAAIGGMFAEVESYAADQDDGTPGWAIMFDPARCPVSGLRWQAQIVGERLPQGATEAQMRDQNTKQPNQTRGTLQGIAKKAQLSLTGDKTVLIHPRFRADLTPDPDYLTVQTLSVQTPNPTKTMQDILSIMPADIVLNYSAVTGASWADIQSAYATWTLVQASQPTWNDVANAVGLGGLGWIVWTA